MQFLPLSIFAIFTLFSSAARAESPIFELSGVDAEQWSTSLSLEQTSNKNGALYFQVQYSGSDEMVDRYRMFMVTFEAGLANPAQISNNALLLNLKVYPITRFNTIDEVPVALHAGMMSLSTDYILGLNGIASIHALGASTRFQIPGYEEFYVAVSAQALGAYLFRAYSQNQFNTLVSNQGPAFKYGEISTDIGVKFGTTKSGVSPLLQITLIGGTYEAGQGLTLGQLYTEFNAALTDDTRAFLRFGRRWISDPQAGVNGEMTTSIRLGVSKDLR